MRPGSTSWRVCRPSARSRRCCRLRPRAGGVLRGAGVAGRASRGEAEGRADRPPAVEDKVALEAGGCDGRGRWSALWRMACRRPGNQTSRTAASGWACGAGTCGFPARGVQQVFLIGAPGALLPLWPTQLKWSCSSNEPGNGGLTGARQPLYWALFGWQHVSSAGFPTPTSLASAARTDFFARRTGRKVVAGP